MGIFVFKGALHDRYSNSATALTLVCRILLSMLRKVTEAFVQLLSSEINNPDNMLPF